MKKTVITLLVTSTLYFVGCQNELDTETTGLVTEGGAVTSTVIKNSISSSYLLLSNRLNIIGQWDWGGGLVFQDDLILQDIASDDMEKKWASDGDQPWMDEINNYNFTASNGEPNGLWKYDYEGIRRLNLVLEMLTRSDIEAVTGITTARKNQLLGEAYFLRSYYYFSLVTNFGDVPLIVAPVKTYQEAYAVAVRTDKPLVWDKIKSDLVLAKALLPNSKYSSTTEKWRVSKGAVVALQAKAALYTEKWAKVPALVDELAGLGFSLNANYFDSFRTEFTDNEVIFAYDHQSNIIPRRGNGICAPLDWGFFAPSANFLSSFEANDPRLLYTVNVANKNVNKLLGSLDGTNKGNDDAPTNKIYMRYADALLWKAEALNETGNYAGAIAIINQIRARARSTVNSLGTIPPAGTLPDRPASTDKATVKGWLILKEELNLALKAKEC